MEEISSQGKPTRRVYKTKSRRFRLSANEYFTEAGATVIVKAMPLAPLSLSLRFQES